MVDNNTITVTSPLMPDFDEFVKELKQIWVSKWITNNGDFHKKLETALAEYLKVPYLSLFTNGTIPLLIALQVLKIKGEVITTPYSFVATTHSIWWNGCDPVFVDIDPATGNIDPQKIEAAITPRTTAIMPVHVYGIPCNIMAIKEIADRHGLKVIYDAAHAFGVELKGESILTAGNLSTISFHATKVYNTIEGGAIIMRDAEMKKEIDFLKNFGFADEVTIVGPGINGKLDEIRAAYGLLNLNHVNVAIETRHKIADAYRKALKPIEGITFFEDIPDVKHNYGYFPILVDRENYGISRDELYLKMRRQNILGRRYFYPLINTIGTYRHHPSAARENLPNAYQMSESILCLPIHQDMSDLDFQRVIDCIIK